MQKKTVSVIMPTYNRDYIIDRALESLKNQTFKDFEIIVVDDGSEDKTEDIIKCFMDLDITYIKLEKNYGANHARNVGITKARGEYLAFLDSDNEWLPLNLATKVEMLQKTGEKIGLVFGSFYLVREREKQLFLPTEIDTQELLKQKMLQTNVIDTNTVLVKKQCFQKVGLFNEEMKRLQDWEMFGRIIFEGGYEAIFCKEALVVNKIQKDSISMNTNSLFISWDKIMHERWHDYRKVYEVDGVLNEYMFSDFAKCQVLFLDRLKKLLSFDITENEWEKYWEKKLQQIERMQNANKNLSVLKKWILLEENNLRIDDWLNAHQIQKIAIYGFGYLGKHLMHELALTDRKVEYIIDKNERIRKENVPVFHSLENLPIVETIIVTSVIHYEEIENELRKYITADIISLETILCDLLQ